MPPLARHWRRALWIALFAVLLNALAPVITSVSAAWRAAPAAHCDDAHAHHHAGASPTAAPASVEPDQPHADCAHAPLDDCPFCHVHAGSFGLPAPDPIRRTAAAAPDAAPAAWSPTPHRFDPWRHAHSRGPPVSA